MGKIALSALILCVIPRIHAFENATENLFLPSITGCNEGIECVPHIQCPAHVYESVKKCTTGLGNKGVCCTTGQNHTSKYKSSVLRIVLNCKTLKINF